MAKKEVKDKGAPVIIDMGSSITVNDGVITITADPTKKHDPFLPEGKDIDQRMAELLEDHKRMGAR